MLIESSALYAVWSIVFIIVYSVGSPAQILLLTTLGNIQVLCYPLLCIMVEEETLML